MHLISESSRVDSPVPTVHRQESKRRGPGSRLYEQFAGLPPSSVTHVDLHEDVSSGDYEGFDRPERISSTHTNPLYRTSSAHQPLALGLQRHPHRRPQHPAFQVCSII